MRSSWTPTGPAGRRRRRPRTPRPCRRASRVQTRRLAALRPGDADLVEDFTDLTLDPHRWVDHYLPHWTTPDRSRARYALTENGLQLRIEADQLDWRPEDAPLRVSNLQTATFSGPVGSTRGTHRHRPDGLTVRTVTPARLLWAPPEPVKLGETRSR